MRPLLLLLPLFACTGQPTTTPTTPTAVHPAVTIAGADSSIRTPSYHRLRTREQLLEVWGLHTRGQVSPGGRHSQTGPAMPEVDFTHCEVVAVFAGDGWNSDGIQAISIVEEPDYRRFRFDHLSYQTEGPDGGGRRVAAYGFFVLPRTDLPLVLEENVQPLIGEPPVWKEVGRR